MTIRRPYRAPVAPATAPIICRSCKRPLGETRPSGTTKIPRTVFVMPDGRLQCKCPICDEDIVLPYERADA